MPHGSHADRPGGRLARSYLSIRAEQTAERQPRGGECLVQGTVVVPRLDTVQLNSPEATAQVRLANLARLATGGEPWFSLAHD